MNKRRFMCVVGILLISLVATAGLYAYFAYVAHQPLKPPA